MSEFAEKAQKVVISDSAVGTTSADSRMVSTETSVRPWPECERAGQEHGRGRAELARACMRRGLIDDYLLAVFAVILGKGHQFFGALEVQQTLRPVEVKHFKAGRAVPTLRERAIRMP